MYSQGRGYTPNIILAFLKPSTFTFAVLGMQVSAPQRETLDSSGGLIGIPLLRMPSMGFAQTSQEPLFGRLVPPEYLAAQTAEKVCVVYRCLLTMSSYCSTQACFVFVVCCSSRMQELQVRVCVHSRFPAKRGCLMLTEQVRSACFGFLSANQTFLSCNFYLISCIWIVKIGNFPWEVFVVFS